MYPTLLSQKLGGGKNMKIIKRERSLYENSMKKIVKLFISFVRKEKKHSVTIPSPLDQKLKNGSIGKLKKVFGTILEKKIV